MGWPDCDRDRDWCREGQQHMHLWLALVWASCAALIALAGWSLYSALA
jgi:hypothetical protein